ncbi:hypothetical protein AYJ57_12975 [Salipiger sp. CCB-MM3]|uniref:hypothetical protein n=1 Tax=Roseobacteraceae TaxID=2854170 RepID=UPI00080AB9C9|nr:MULTISPECIES: hypothetical protein [Roseobacteraceae]ANT61202.1 hypothetical protein AYJ57_12975 [Salipiger sp. CCB-MM3]MCA0994441.1 hypothetical protein [Alloyangia pacifica]
MKLTHLSAIAAVLVMASGAAMANTKQVKCDGFVIAIADEIAMAAEENAGSMTEAEAKICEAATQISVSGDDPEVHEIVILPYEIRTTVVIIPVD